MEKLESNIKPKERSIKGDRVDRMSEEQLNEEYISEQLQGICQDCMHLNKIISIIRKMLSEAYTNGLEQYKFDLKTDILLDKIAIPEELSKDKSFEDLCEMPTYRDLYEKNQFLMKRENKLQTIEQMFRSGTVDLEELSKLVKGDYNEIK